MYITVHRVRDQEGQTAIHSFLHRHDENDCPFPSDPLMVPRSAPGRLVRKDVSLPPGGNEVLSYLDLVLPEGTWSDAWKTPLARLAERIGDHALPLVAQIEQLTVIFGAVDQENAPDEYTELLRAALRMMHDPQAGQAR